MMSDLVKGNKAAAVQWKGKARLRLCARNRVQPSELDVQQRVSCG